MSNYIPQLSYIL